MADELTSQQKMSRFASPLIGERSPKRTRTSTESQESEKPKNVIDIVEGGDVLLVVNDLFSTLETPVGLRVSSFALSMVRFSSFFVDCHSATADDHRPRQYSKPNSSQQLSAKGIQRRSSSFPKPPTVTPR